MGLTIPSRRGFLTGLTALLAAPSIVRASNLMPISVLKPEFPAKGARFYVDGAEYVVTNHGEGFVYLGGYNIVSIAPGASEIITVPPGNVMQMLGAGGGAPRAGDSWSLAAIGGP